MTLESVFLNNVFRYPYGHPVQGLAKIRIYKEYYYSPKENFTNITETKKVNAFCSLVT